MHHREGDTGRERLRYREGEIEIKGGRDRGKGRERLRYTSDSVITVPI